MSSPNKKLFPEIPERKAITRLGQAARQWTSFAESELALFQHGSQSFGRPINKAELTKVIKGMQDTLDSIQKELS